MLEYDCCQLIPNTLYRINLKLGFRVQPRINVYFRQIIDDLVAAGEFDISSCYPSLRENNVNGDFKFVVIHRVASHENTFTLRDKFIMNAYGTLSILETSVPGAFGLDTSNVDVEDVPLIIKSDLRRRIKRVDLP